MIFSLRTFYRIFAKTPFFMTPNQANTIYPCPFSKGYGIPVEQAWSSLKIFFIYRFILSSLFIILFYSSFGPSLLGFHNAQLYTYSSLSYWLLSLISGIFIFWRILNYTSQAQIIIFTDIIFISLIMHASGGISSGIGILLAVSIAAGGLLVGGRCALLFAALASLSILTEQLYAIQTHSFVNTSFTYAGMLGASFFTIAYLSYVLAKRAEQSEILASAHQQTISNLEELNRYIIQHLQSGIIISNSQQQIRMYNEAALKILTDNDNTTQPQNLSEISTQLSKGFQLWLDDLSQDIAVIRLPNQSEVHIRFSLLKTQQETFHMIIMEDISLYNQRLQQNKLASLGRLTASIAHEIRNPLGAISHAGQLLSEASELSPEDQRLTEIIQSHCLRVNKIIEDVLQLSRRRPSKREKINLSQWIHSYLQNFILASGCMPDCFEIVVKEENLWIYMDMGHLKQILDNLCSNALKYGDLSTDKIIIELSLLDHSPYIRIVDNGPRIDPETASHLFEPFFTTSPTGTGLGLYISRELAELNQAKLSYAITLDNKSNFMLCLPSANNSKIEI
jgi:two-component system sensor histidine kinase PilS (NtrC family)